MKAKPEAKLEAKPEDMFMQAWKAQLDAGLRVLETITEGAIRMHEAQLEAATEAHADADATRKAILAATDASQLMKLCAEWAARQRREVARLLALAVRDGHANRRRGGEVRRQRHAGSAAAGSSTSAMIDGAYQQWLDAVQRFYQPVESPRA